MRHTINVFAFLLLAWATHAQLPKPGTNGAGDGDVQTAPNVTQGPHSNVQIKGSIPKVGSITQGACSNVQIGTGNRATTNCGDSSTVIPQSAPSKTLLPKNMGDVSDFNCHVEEKSHVDKATGQTITTWRARISVYRNGKKAEEIPVAFSRRRTRDDATKVCQELAALFSAEREKTR